MYSNDSEDNNIRIRRQTTENIFEYEDNKNSDINEVKQNRHKKIMEVLQKSGANKFNKNQFSIKIGK
jgi:hypothetical protein